MQLEIDNRLFRCVSGKVFLLGGVQAACCLLHTCGGFAVPTFCHAVFWDYGIKRFLYKMLLFEGYQRMSDHTNNVADVHRFP